MSENRSLAVLEILVHLSATLPDRYVLGSADIPASVAIETINDHSMPEDWSTLDVHKREATRRVGDDWVRAKRSAILSVPSVVVGERNYVLNPAHPEFKRVAFAEPVPFRLDLRLVRSSEHRTSTDLATH